MGGRELPEASGADLLRNWRRINKTIRDILERLVEEARPDEGQTPCPHCGSTCGVGQAPDLDAYIKELERCICPPGEREAGLDAR